MAVIEVETLDELVETLKTSPHAVVLFTQPRTCVPCRQFAPHFDAASNILPEYAFIKIDLGKDFDVADEFNIQGVPTVRRYLNGLYEADVQGRTALQLKEELGL